MSVMEKDKIGRAAAEDKVWMFQHPRNDQIVFEEGPHLYFVNDRVVPFSVTGCKEFIFDKFDAVAAIRAMKNNKKKGWPRLPYADEGPGGDLVAWSDERITKSWEDNGKEASEFGTRCHGIMERYLMGEPVTITYGSDESYCITMAAAKLEQDRVHHGLTPFEAEGVYWGGEKDGVTKETPVAPGNKGQPIVAGSIDLIYKKEGDPPNVVHLRDHKFTKIKDPTAFESTKYRSKFIRDFAATKKGEYHAQLTLYRHILEEYYGLRVASMEMYVYHPFNKGLLVVPFSVEEKDRVDLTPLFVEIRKKWVEKVHEIVERLIKAGNWAAAFKVVKGEFKAGFKMPKRIREKLLEYRARSAKADARKNEVQTSTKGTM